MVSIHFRADIFYNRESNNFSNNKRNSFGVLKNISGFSSYHLSSACIGVRNFNSL